MGDASGSGKLISTLTNKKKIFSYMSHLCTSAKNRF